MRLVIKSKYTRRWKGKDGKWHYEYSKEKGGKFYFRGFKFDTKKEAEEFARNLNIAAKRNYMERRRQWNRERRIPGIT